MIPKEEIKEVVRQYEPSEITIATLGSHSALNILKGAKEEGFRTLCICRQKDKNRVSKVLSC